MTPEFWSRVDELYHAALEQPDDMRPAFLAQECGGDMVLQSKVEKLLKAHTRVGVFLSEPALHVAAKVLAGHQSMSFSGRRVAHYDVLKALGKGGMGEVYLAHDVRLERTVALKILPPELAADSGYLQRFIREARAASSLNHPNVATIYDADEDDGIRFIVMEYVEGETLASRMRGRRVRAAEIAAIGIQVAGALDAAHRKGITHRDIKPANIMINSEGQVKVLDFGLAKIAGRRELATKGNRFNEADTNAGIVLGTAKYMSPEQVTGGTIDHRTDIFTLGVMLYEMAAGRPPFAGTTATETMDHILHAQPDRLSNTDGRMSATLGPIVSRCMEKDPARRYQSAQDLLVDLKRFQRGVERALLPHLNRTRRSALAAAAAVFLTLAIVEVSSLVRNGFPAEAPADSLLVLPLESAAGDTEYLSDGITAGLITSFSNVSNLRVINRTTAMGYKSSSMTALEISKELSVRAVLTGTMALDGDTVTIQAHLMDDTGALLLSEQYTHRLEDVSLAQAEIAQRVSERLRLRPDREAKQRLTKRYTDNAVAYQLYLKGRHESLKYTEDGIDKGLAYFRQAIGLDRGYALAYAGLAEAYMNGSGWYFPSSEAGPLAKEAALEAFGIDSTLSEAHTMLGLIAASYDRDWQTAEKHFRRSMGLNPGLASARDYYGFYVLAVTGRLDESLEELKLAQQFDPQSPMLHQDMGQVLYFAGRHDAAIAELLKAVHLDPNFWLAHVNLGSAYVQKGMYTHAIAAYRKTVNAPRFPDGAAWVAYGLAMSGKLEEARRETEALKRSKPHATPWVMALLYAALGDNDLAVESLTAARDEHFIIFATLNVDPAFDSLRRDPRFIALLRSIGLTPQP